MGANDKPLLKSCNSCGDSVMLLRLCTVREVAVFAGSLGIKNGFGEPVWLWRLRCAFPFLASLSSFTGDALGCISMC